MPKSKRSKVVNLTAVKAKRKELKQGLVETIRECVDKYSHIYVFAYDNMRTQKFKDVRSMWADSRFFLGKNRVIQKALGADDEEAYRPELDSLAADLVGQVGLLFTDRKPAEVSKFVAEFEETDFARAGYVPEQTITVPAGRLTEVPHTMAESLQKLGMPVRLDKGVVVLPYDHALCKAGEPVTPDQGKLLKYFGHALAKFRLRLLSRWSGGKYSSLDGDDSDDEAAAPSSSSAAAGGAGAGAVARGAGRAKGAIEAEAAAAARKAKGAKEKRPAPKGRSGSGVGNARRGGAGDSDDEDDDDDDDEDEDAEGGMSEDDEDEDDE